MDGCVFFFLDFRKRKGSYWSIMGKGYIQICITVYNIMQCKGEQECPFLYSCVDSLCSHISLLSLNEYVVVGWLLMVGLCAVVGYCRLSVGCIIYGVFIDYLNYPYHTAVNYGWALMLGMGLYSLFVSLTHRQESTHKLMINFPVCHVGLPVAICSFNFGATVSEASPVMVGESLSILIGLCSMALFWYQYREMEFEAKVTSGALKSLLPERYLNKIRQEFELQLPIISEDDQETESEGQSPSSKKARRTQFLKMSGAQRLPWIDMLLSVGTCLGFMVLNLVCLGLEVEPSLTTGVVCCLLVVYQVLVMWLYLIPRSRTCQQIGQRHEVNLTLSSEGVLNLSMIGVGSVAGGFCQSLCSVGLVELLVLCCTHKVGLRRIIDTCCYFVFFVGLDAFCLGGVDLAHGTPNAIDVAEYVTVALLPGGLISIFLYFGFNKLQDITVRLVLMLTATALCMLAAVLALVRDSA